MHAHTHTSLRWISCTAGRSLAQQRNRGCKDFVGEKDAKKEGRELEQATERDGEGKRSIASERESERPRAREKEKKRDRQSEQEQVSEGASETD